MTSKEALKELEIATNWSSDEDIDKDLYNLWGNVACRTIKKDLDRLEELEKAFDTLSKDYEMEHTLRIRLENANYELVRKNQENEKKLEAIKDLESELGIDVITMFYKYIKWQKLDTYNTKENDWVLVLCKDKMNGQLYALPLIAELRNDGKWYSQEDVCLSDYLEIVAWKNIDVIYECGKLTKEYLENE